VNVDVFSIGLWAVRVIAAAVVAGAFLPLVKVGWWPVRVWDFPRVQLAALAALLIAAIVLAGVARKTWPRVDVGLVAALAVSVIWQGWFIAPFTSLWPRRVPDAAGSVRESGRVSVLIANLDVRNPSPRAAADVLGRVDADVLVLIEIDEEWASALSSLRDRYAYQVNEVRPDGRGLALWSRVPVLRAEVRELITPERPSIFARLERRPGEAFNVIAVHPTPPALEREDREGRFDSRIRDAELVVVAKHIAEHQGERWMVVGDFNDVAWSHTTRLFQRISGLLDPRVGRGLFNTYHARYPFLRYPLDHVFVSEHWAVNALTTKRVPGSDHFAMYGELQLAGGGAVEEPEADAEDAEEARELVEDGVEDARDAASSGAEP